MFIHSDLEDAAVQHLEDAARPIFIDSDDLPTDGQRDLLFWRKNSDGPASARGH